MSRLAATPDMGNPGWVTPEPASSDQPADAPDGNVVGETPGSLYSSYSKDFNTLHIAGEHVVAQPLLQFRDTMVGPARDQQYEIPTAFYDFPRIGDDRNMNGLHVVIGPYPWTVTAEGDMDDLTPEDYEWVRRVPPDSWDAPFGVD